tara:strand:+ start:1373 stop:1498 length:126 start_codon:yes stop_codon:yes gene_type:complete
MNPDRMINTHESGTTLEVDDIVRTAYNENAEAVIKKSAITN